MILRITPVSRARTLFLEGCSIAVLPVDFFGSSPFYPFDDIWYDSPMEYIEILTGTGNLGQHRRAFRHLEETTAIFFEIIEE